MSTATGTKAAEEAEPKKKSKKMLIIIIAAVVLLGGGGAGGYLMLAGGSSGTPTPAASPSLKPGKVTALDPITVNLAGGHYLKIGVALQGIDGVAEAGAPDASRIADLTISEFTDRDLAQLSSEQGRVKIKAELLKKIQDAYPEAVMDLYFTEFVMQ